VALRVTWRGGSAPIALPEGVRKQLADGSWDAMRTLLEARDAIVRKSAELPYPARF
jgi:hypothetical protein